MGIYQNVQAKTFRPHQNVRHQKRRARWGLAFVIALWNNFDSKALMRFNYEAVFELHIYYSAKQDWDFRHQFCLQLQCNAFLKKICIVVVFYAFQLLVRWPSFNLAEISCFQFFFFFGSPFTLFQKHCKPYKQQCIIVLRNRKKQTMK